MPFFYRTPDLIAYARNERDISPKSDVFQLGLVLAELFTGRNPARRPNDRLDPLEMEPLSNIPVGMAGSIATLIRRMLEIDSDRRPNAADLLDPWQGVFGTAMERAHALDGKVKLICNFLRTKASTKEPVNFCFDFRNLKPSPEAATGNQL